MFKKPGKTSKKKQRYTHDLNIRNDLRIFRGIYKLFESKELSISLILKPPIEIRGERDEEQVTQLMPSIRTMGVLNSLLVRPKPKARGFFEVLGGINRLEAAKRVGLDKVPCRIINVDDAEAKLIALIDNILKTDLVDYDVSITLRDLLQTYPDKYPSQRILANILGKSETWVSEYLAILDLEGILSQKKLKSIFHKTAADIRALSKEPKTEVISLIRERDKPITRREIEKIRKTSIDTIFRCTHCDDGTRTVKRSDCNQTLVGLTHTFCGFAVEPIVSSDEMIETSTTVTMPKTKLDKKDFTILREAVASAMQIGSLPKGGVYGSEIPSEYVYPTYLWLDERILLFLDDVNAHPIDSEKVDAVLTARGWLITRMTFSSPLSNQRSSEIIDSLKEAYAQRITVGKI